MFAVNYTLRRRRTLIAEVANSQNHRRNSARSKRASLNGKVAGTKIKPRAHPWKILIIHR